MSCSQNDRSAVAATAGCLIRNVAMSDPRLAIDHVGVFQRQPVRDRARFLREGAEMRAGSAGIEGGFSHGIVGVETREAERGDEGGDKAVSRTTRVHDGGRRRLGMAN